MERLFIIVRHLFCSKTWLVLVAQMNESRLIPKFFFGPTSKLIFIKLLSESMHHIQHTQSVTLVLEVIITEHACGRCRICVKRSFIRPSEHL